MGLRLFAIRHRRLARFSISDVGFAGRSQPLTLRNGREHGVTLSLRQVRTVATGMRAHGGEIAGVLNRGVREAVAHQDRLEVDLLGRSQLLVLVRDVVSKDGAVAAKVRFASCLAPITSQPCCFHPGQLEALTHVKVILAKPSMERRKPNAQEGMHIHSSLLGRPNRLDTFIGVAEPHADRLIEKDDGRVAVPGKLVLVQMDRVRGVFAVDVAWPEFESECGEAGAAWSTVEPKCDRVCSDCVSKNWM